MIKRRAKITLLLTVGFMITVTFNACGGFFQSASNVAGLTSALQCNGFLEDTFKTTYYPFLVENCGNCHRVGGGGNGSFADPDASQSFNQFDIRGKDLVINRGLDPLHQSGLTGLDFLTINGAPATQEAIDGYDAAWETAKTNQLACQANLDNSNNPAIPLLVGEDVLPTSAAFETSSTMMSATDTARTLTWDLGSEIVEPSGMAFAGATFEMDVRTFTSPTDQTHYIFSNPVLRTGATAIHIQLIEIKINDQAILSATTFKGVNRRVPANQSRDLTLTEMVVPFTTNGTDTIAVTFGRLDEVDFSPLSFTQLTGGGGVLQQNCAGCHSAAGGNQGGFSIDDYQGLLNNFLLAPYAPANSEIILRMSDPARPMPPTGLLPQDQVDLVSDWILDGAPDN